MLSPTQAGPWRPMDPPPICLICLSRCVLRTLSCCGEETVNTKMRELTRTPTDPPHTGLRCKDAHNDPWFKNIPRLLSAARTIVALCLNDPFLFRDALQASRLSLRVLMKQKRDLVPVENSIIAPNTELKQISIASLTDYRQMLVTVESRRRAPRHDGDDQSISRFLCSCSKTFYNLPAVTHMPFRTRGLSSHAGSPVKTAKSPRAVMRTLSTGYWQILIVNPNALLIRYSPANQPLHLHGTIDMNDI
ncbi:hypothetical protein F2P81_003133 [Scophthalmus maximus]|uniref:Uncharacterized protein n=1 Tax=Scophthalmus maximus TaxID=52904 RepID=A0A6A4TFG0_SCOMX|nr:hypothetical protein F2P81_003133 [Scophthalmus maximus]